MLAVVIRDFLSWTSVFSGILNVILVNHVFKGVTIQISLCTTEERKANHNHYKPSECIFSLIIRTGLTFLCEMCIFNVGIYFIFNINKSP